MKRYLLLSLIGTLAVSTIVFGLKLRSTASSKSTFMPGFTRGTQSLGYPEYSFGSSSFVPVGVSTIGTNLFGIFQPGFPFFHSQGLGTHYFVSASPQVGMSFQSNTAFGSGVPGVMTTTGGAWRTPGLGGIGGFGGVGGIGGAGAGAGIRGTMEPGIQTAPALGGVGSFEGIRGQGGNVAGFPPGFEPSKEDSEFTPSNTPDTNDPVTSSPSNSSNSTSSSLDENTSSSSLAENATGPSNDRALENTAESSNNAENTSDNPQNDSTSSQQDTNSNNTMNSNSFDCNYPDAYKCQEPDRLKQASDCSNIGDFSCVCEDNGRCFNRITNKCRACSDPTVMSIYQGKYCPSNCTEISESDTKQNSSDNNENHTILSSSSNDTTNQA